ncbi:lipoprotein [Spiroplasma apis]|uniref:Lipoprotein n=1 Tax=Spiroplasma apis B31 TaxID=1276258 RepID=V5RL80_SPIAP|nr:lipoprotein [Spiroplasma apis]AHB36560.1 hypothetical protein SAPIS_v1c07150 [Spiroplasma apis B31]
MKKLLSLLGALGMVASTGATVVACGKTTTETRESNATIMSVTTDNDTISKKSGESIVSVKLKEALSSSDKLTITSDKGNESILKIADGVKNNKNNKIYEFKITLKDDLPQKETTEKLIVNLNGKATNKSTEISISPRSEFDLSLIGDFINGSGLVGGFNPFGNKGFLSIDSGNMSNKIFIEGAVKNYVKNVLELEIVQGFIKLDAQTVLNMVQITHLDNSGKEVTGNNAVASIKITVKDGHANDIEDYHVVGEAKVKLAEKKKISEIIKDFNLGNITLTDENKLKDEVLNALLFKYNDDNLKNAFKSQDVELDQVKYDKNTKSGSVKLKYKFNSSIQNDKDTEITFKVN